METIIQGIVDIINALPAGPYFVFETPFPAFEQISEGNTNFGSSDFGSSDFGSTFDVGSTFGDLNIGNPDVSGVSADGIAE